MNIVSLIAEQARERNDLFDREAAIMQSLVNSGVRVDEADAALSLMQSLAQDRADAPQSARACASCLRTMTRQERSRFSTEAFGLVSRLARLGIISDDQREDIMERSMGLYAGRIELSHIKAVVALTLFAADGDGDAARTASARPQDVSWN